MLFIGQFWKRFLQTLKINNEFQSNTVASFCMGVYIAFSPFVGLHTLMAVCFSWLFGLSFWIVLSSSCIINNPWTMLPVYGLDYTFGIWFLRFFGFESLFENPSWIESWSETVRHYIPLGHISLWAFLIGGNILAIILSLAAYPLIKRLVVAQASTQPL